MCVIGIPILSQQMISLYPGVKTVDYPYHYLRLQDLKTLLMIAD